MHDRAAWEAHPNIGGLAGLLLHIHDSFRMTSAALVALPVDATLVTRARRLFLPLARTLHHHHHAEEQMLFPLVRERGGEHPARLVDDHHALMARLDEVERWFGRDDPAGLAKLLRTLHEELSDHLEREEELAVPVLLELTHEEARRMLYGW